jgi:UDP-glucose 4-epimerase
MTVSYSPTKTVLITGGAGFLGRACARRFRAAGWRVVGIGHSNWINEDARLVGYDHWVNDDVTSGALTSLVDLSLDLRAVVHCASNSSVPYSLEQPFDAYERTVGSTVVLLEHLRRYAPTTVVFYPSSAAVYGATPDRPLHEADTPNPVSPYGFDKLMVETLLAKYAVCFGQRAIAVRFFSIYGAGLRKQLLWDASKRLLSGESSQPFYGTGEETRDWIHVEDAASLMLHLAERSPPASEMPKLQLINGASGIRVTVHELLTRLAATLGVSTEIRFNGISRVGDPRFYHADVEKLKATGWQPILPLDSGLLDYAKWIKGVA